MKLTIAVLALLCLGTAVNAAADGLKLPLAGLFAQQAADAMAQANITLGDLAPKVSMPDIMATLQSMPKFQMPSVTVQGGMSLGNASNIMVPLVPLMGLKAKKILPLVSLLGLLNHTSSLGATLNLTMPSLPKPNLNINVSSAVVPLHALLALPKAVPLQPLLASLNATKSFSIPAINIPAHNITLPHPHMPNINISDVGVPLTFLLSHKVKGLPLLSFLGNVSANLPVFSVSKNISLPVVSAMPFKAFVSLRGLPKMPSINIDGVTKLAMSALSSLSVSKNITVAPMASMTKSLNISDLPIAALLSHKANLMANLHNMMGNVTAGPTVDINVRPGSVGMKNVAFNLTHPTLGLKNLALALNIPVPELAMKLAALNVSVPLPDVKMGSKAINMSVPMLDLKHQMSNVTVSVPMASVSMPSVSMDFNKSGDGNSTSFVKNFAFTKPGLSMGSANITLPIMKPDLALKLAQLGINVPTPQVGLKRANIGAQVPLPGVNMGSKAINVTVPMPDVQMKQIGVNLTVPDIKLPQVELNVSGMPKLGLDALKSATLLSWLKDAGFYSLNKTVSADGTTTIDLQRN